MFPFSVTGSIGKLLGFPLGGSGFEPPSEFAFAAPKRGKDDSDTYLPPTQVLPSKKGVCLVSLSSQAKNSLTSGKNLLLLGGLLPYVLRRVLPRRALPWASGFLP